MAEKSDQETPWPAVTFFIPLPEPLGLPDGYEIHGLRPPSRVDLREQPRAAILGPLLVLHQVELEHSSSGLRVDACFRLALTQVTAPREAIDETSMPYSGLGQRLTIVEAVVPQRDASGDDFTVEFDEALEAIRRLQRSVSAALQEPVRLATLRNLPYVIPMSPGRLDLTGVARTELREPWLFRLNVHALHDEIGSSIVEAEQFVALQIASDQAARGGAFHPYAELRREGWVQRDFEGNLVLAAALAGMAGEVLLDTLLKHMLWEEEADPDEAAKLFEDTGFAARLRRHYHERLGGVWRETGPGPVADFQSQTAQLRHRVVHAGYEPTRSEVADSFDALWSLETFIGDRLASSRNRRNYPRTAIAWMGWEGLARRKAVTNALRRLSEDPEEPNWVDAFAYWSHWFRRALEPRPLAPGKDLSGVDLIAVIGDGPLYWALHDRATRHAAKLDDPPQVDGQQISTLEALALASEEEAPGMPHAVLVDYSDDLLEELVDGATWRREADIFSHIVYNFPTG
jgi:hypothetical protein